MKRAPLGNAALVLALAGFSLLAGCGSAAEPTPTVQAPAPIVTTTPPPPPEPTLPTPVETATEPTLESQTRAPEPRSRMPRSLVGTWDGDRAQITFSRRGDVTMLFKQGGGRDTGTVVVDGSSMELHLTGGVLAIDDWEISRFDAGYGYEFFNLVMDGTSYVRDVPK